MDEEELEQPSSKINLGSFFERVDSVEKVADNALSRANANLGIISNQKLIINSLSVTIEAMETKIRDIANYIIIEKKLEKDVEEDRLLEEQDRLQKQAMVDRSTTIMGEPGPQGEPGKPAEQQQGGGSSLLGALLKLGATSFAIKYIGPVILPKLLLLAKTKLIPLIGTALKSGFVKLAALIGKVITGLVSKIPLVGKALAGSALFTGVGSAIIGIGNFISNALGGKDEGESSVVDSNVGMTDSTVETGMTDTMQEKDLVPAVPAESFSEYQNRTRNKRGGGAKKEEESKKRTITKEQIIKMSKDYKALVEKGKTDEPLTRTEEFERDRLRIILDKIGVETRDLTIMGGATIEDVNKSILQVNPNAKEAPRFGDVGGLIEFENKNKDLDLSSNNVDGDMTQAIAKTNERIDNLIGAENKEQNNGNLVSANKPNVTEATLKLAAAPLPFVKVIKNNQLSTSPKSYNGLPPEIAAMIS